MAAIGVALWKYVMRYAPHTPTYFNRDRFVLSNGEPTKIQYFPDQMTDQFQVTHVSSSIPSSTSQASRR
jgi:transketolase